jgi:hypothetical protein
MNHPLSAPTLGAGRSRSDSVLDTEPVELPGGRGGVGFYFADVAVHAIFDVFEELVHVGVWAFHDEFDSAIGEVADVAEDVVLEGDVLDGVAEADALDAAGEVADATMHQGGAHEL